METAIMHAFKALGKRLDRHDAMFELIFKRFDNVDERLDVYNYRLGNIEVAVEDLKEEVMVMGKAPNKDAVTLVNHEKRIKKLELKAI